MSLRRIVIVAALALGMFGADVVHAQVPYDPISIYGFGFGGAYRGYRNNVPTPPYFALHPPVYYGKRYERPYGDSPFASWSQLQANPGYMPTARTERVQQLPMSGYEVIVAEQAKPTPPLTQTNPFFKPKQ